MNQLSTSTEDFIIKMGVDICNHYLSNEEKDIEEDYKIKNEVLSNLIHAHAHLFSHGSQNFAEPSYKWYSLQIISLMADIVVKEYIHHQFSNIAEIKNVNWGDNCLIEINNDGKYVYYDLKTKTRKNIIGSQIIMNPISNKISLSEIPDKLKNLDIATLVSRTAKSFKEKIDQEIFLVSRSLDLPIEEVISSLNKKPVKISFEGDTTFVIVNDESLEIVMKYDVGFVVKV